eukprot:IDg9195t1
MQSPPAPNMSADNAARPEMRYGTYVEKDGILHKKTRVWKHAEDSSRRDCHPEWEVGLQNTRVVGDQDKLEIEVSAAHRTDTFITDNLAEYNDWYPVLKAASEKSIKDYYGFVKVLGEGHFGKVLLGRDHRTGESFAVKVIRKNKKEVRSAQLIQREMDILRLVNHKNIVRLYDLFDTESKLYFVLECMKGGVLYEVLSKKHIHFSEERASHVLRDVLEGLQYLHALDIVHRDIKPENS